MKKHECMACGWVYDPQSGLRDQGIEPGTAWEDVPDDFTCPLCGVGKDQFQPVD
jgi:rubredoxin